MPRRFYMLEHMNVDTLTDRFLCEALERASKFPRTGFLADPELHATFTKGFVEQFVDSLSEAALAERRRVQSIIESIHAFGKRDAALGFALETNMSAREAIELLATFPHGPEIDSEIDDEFGTHGLTWREIVEGRRACGHA